jgi:VanZ family protein
MGTNCLSETNPEIPASWRWLLWVFFVGVWTAALLTTEPVDVAQAVLPPPIIFPAAKLLHVSAYALLAVLSGWLFLPGRWRWVLLVFMCFHAFGTEFFQQFVPERGPSLWDVGIDHIGIAIGLTISCKWWLRLEDRMHGEASD